MDRRTRSRRSRWKERYHSRSTNQLQAILTKTCRGSMLQVIPRWWTLSTTTRTLPLRKTRAALLSSKTSRKTLTLILPIFWKRTTTKYEKQTMMKSSQFRQWAKRNSRWSCLKDKVSTWASIRWPLPRRTVTSIWLQRRMLLSQRRQSQKCRRRQNKWTPKDPRRRYHKCWPAWWTSRVPQSRRRPVVKLHGSRRTPKTTGNLIRVRVDLR